MKTEKRHGVTDSAAGSRLFSILVATALVATLALAATPAQAAGPPLVTSTTFSGVTASAATLKGSVDPNAIRTIAHFAYTTQSQFKDSGFEGAAHTPDITLQPTVVGTGDLKAGSATVTGAEASSGAFAPGQEVKATGIPAGTKITAIATEPVSGKLQLTLSKAATASVPGAKLKATGPQPIEARIEGLSPQTAYRFRIEAENTKAEETTGPEALFATYSLPPVFSPCPNDVFRSGESRPPVALLPDCRAYERATPEEKNGNDVYGSPGFIRAASTGGSITFMTSSGVPGGEGAQAIPPYLALRGPGESGWASAGLFPPASAAAAPPCSAGPPTSPAPTARRLGSARSPKRLSSFVTASPARPSR